MNTQNVRNLSIITVTVILIENKETQHIDKRQNEWQGRDDSAFDYPMVTVDYSFLELPLNLAKPNGTRLMRMLVQSRKTRDLFGCLIP
jgi:hypothetical protein